MPFKSGESGNSSGRPLGSTNVVTNELRYFIVQFLNKNLEGIQDTFDQLEAKEKLNFIEKLLKHVIPKPMETEEPFQVTSIEII